MPTNIDRRAADLHGASSIGRPYWNLVDAGRECPACQEVIPVLDANSSAIQFHWDRHLERAGKAHCSASCPGFVLEAKGDELHVRACERCALYITPHEVASAAERFFAELDLEARGEPRACCRGWGVFDVDSDDTVQVLHCMDCAPEACSTDAEVFVVARATLDGWKPTTGGRLDKATATP
jgi:hypothetical protein